MRRIEKEHEAGCCAISTSLERARVFWLSFCDGDRPQGQQFLGACLVDVTSTEAADAAVEVARRFPSAQPGAEWIFAASRKAWELGCNPGGEVAAVEIPQGYPMLKHYQFGVLMDRATIADIDTQIKVADA